MPIRFIEDQEQPTSGTRIRFLEEEQPNTPLESIWTKAGGTLPDIKKAPEFYSQGAKKLTEKPFETLFPMASSIQNPDVNIPFTDKKIPVPTVVKQNLAVPFDIAGWLDRGIDYLSGGALKQGQKAIKELIPGENIVSENLKTGVDILANPSTFIGTGTIAKALSKSPEKIIENTAKKTAAGFKPSTFKSSFDEVLKPVMNEKGSVEIPDIDDIANAIDGPVPEGSYRNMKEIKSDLGEVPKKGFRNPDITDAEAVLLASPTPEGSTAFPQVLRQAESANRFQLGGTDDIKKTMTPLDIAASEKAMPALDKIKKIRQQKGDELGKILDTVDEYSIATNQFVDASPVQEKFNLIIKERLGAQVTPDGKIVNAAGDVINDPASVHIVRQMHRLIRNLDNQSTPKEVNSTIRSLRSLIDEKLSSQATKRYLPAEAVAEDLRKELKGILDSHIESSVNWNEIKQVYGQDIADRYRQLNKDYANISKIEDRLSRGLSEVVDEATNQPKMGASLLKSAIVSNSDRGTKSLFNAVKNLTGVDLYREAAIAKTAMEAVGDPRINSLLKSIGVIEDIATKNKLGLTIAAAKKISGSVTGSKADQLLRFYNKYNIEPELSKKPFKQSGILNNQRGSIGGAFNSQTKTDNFKKWFGDWEKDPANASKVVDADGKPLVVYHGTNSPFGTNQFTYDFSKGGTGGFSRVYSGDIRSQQSPAIYTTSSLSHAQEYGDAVPLYVNAKKPLIIDVKKELKPWSKEMGYDSVDEMISDYYYNDVYTAANFDQMAIEKAAFAKKSGNDAVIFDFGNLRQDKAPLGKVVMAFEPTQLKSATSNSGAFNSANPDIRGSVPFKELAATGGAALGALTGYGVLKDKINPELGKRKLGR
jgi:hypothetical protein